MKWMIFFSILLISTVITQGCVLQTENSLPVIGPPPTIASRPLDNSGGTAIAIAFKTDEISTSSSEAKDLFIKGLTYSTQYARYNESLAFFDAALAIDSNFTEAWVAKGVALHNLKRYDDAIGNYDRALAIDPNDAGTWSVKAITLGDMGKPEEAAECKRRAAELDPRYGHVMESAGKNQNKTSVAASNECGQNKTGLEIFDPDSGIRYLITQGQDGYRPLLENMTPVLLSIGYQKKCSLPYTEFQRLKTNYRYVALNQVDTMYGRYCYNSAPCRDIPADQFTLLIDKKTGLIPVTECLETGLIFAYRDGVDAGIWSLGEENSSRLDNLTKNVQDIIDSGKVGTECRINLGTAVTKSPPQSCEGIRTPIPAGGDVYLGENCLNISAGVSSGEAISWYRDGRNATNTTPDAIRVVRDARNFFADPNDFLGYEGNWYVGTTEKVAFVIRIVDLRLQPRDNSTLPSNAGNQGTNAPISFASSGKIDPGLQGTINATKDLDYVTAWVVLDEPSGIPDVTLSDISPAERTAWRERQRVAYLNATKPLVDYVRTSGFVVDYIGRTSPAIEVLAFPHFMNELANRSDVRKMVIPKTNHQIINGMLLRKPDETIRVSISFTPPPGFSPWPHGLSGTQLDDYYAQNRIPYENHSRYVLERLAAENVSITFTGPYPTTGIYGEVPVYLLEDFNGGSEVGMIQLDVPAYLV